MAPRLPRTYSRVPCAACGFRSSEADEEADSCEPRLNSDFELMLLHLSSNAMCHSRYNRHSIRHEQPP